MDDVPLFVSQLLSEDFDHDLHFWLGRITDESLPKRIGALGQMVQAHSLVLRKVVEPEHIWYDYMYDIDFPDVSPAMWRALLTFIYGHNCLSTLPFLAQLKLLSLAKGLCIGTLKLEATKLLKREFKPQNFCQALQDPALIKIKEFQFYLQKTIFRNTRLCLNNEDLKLINPDYMKFILFLQGTGRLGTESYAEMWRIFLRWAKARVLQGEGVEMPSNMLSLLNPRIVEPHVHMQRLCCRNLVKMVLRSEDIDLTDDEKLTNKMMMAHYHTIPTKPPYKLYMCTNLHDLRYIDHELFSITVLTDSSSCALPVESSSSVLHLTTSNCDVELYSVVCTGIRPDIRDPELLKTDVMKKYDTAVVYFHPEQTMYNCECTAKLWSVSGEECTKLYEYTFHKKAVVHENFTITFRNLSGAKLMLKPNTEYKLEMLFTTPHPLWLEMTPRVLPARADEELNVRGGAVEKENQVGSHIKCLLYKTYPSKPDKTSKV